MHPPGRAPVDRADAPPRRSALARSAIGGLIVLVLVGFGAAVVASIVTPGGEVVAVSSEAGDGVDRAEGADGAGGADVTEAPEAVNSDLAPASATVLVHVAGAVARPGVVELAEGSRVVDAVARAGGAADDADLAGVNLARLVIDGEQIVVPRVGEAVPGGATGPGGANGAGAGAGSAAGGLVSLNSANAAALESLPGIGPALAARIIAWRDENGGFRSVDELLAVSGIGEKTLDGFRDLVTP